MSAPRFASITASLLARKGEAQPWSDPPKTPLAWDAPAGAEPPRSWQTVPQHAAPQPAPRSVAMAAPQQAATRSGPPRVLPEPRPSHVPVPPVVHAAALPPVVAPVADWKKCSVRMSHHDYERLGILAVKLNKTRHCLLQEAVDGMLSGITRKFGSGCACLGEEKAGACERDCAPDLFEHRAPRA